MTLRKKISWVLIGAALATGSAGAQDADQIRQILMGKGASLTPTVTMERDLIYAEPVQSERLERLSLTITDKSGNTVFRESTAGKPIAVFFSDIGLPDGRYRYSVTATHGLEDTNITLPGFKDSGRGSGSFIVKDGMILTAPERSDGTRGDEQASSEDAPGLLMAGLAMVADFLVGSAHADNLTASGVEPKVYFDDTTDDVSGDSELVEFYFQWNITPGSVEDTGTGLFELKSDYGNPSTDPSIISVEQAETNPDVLDGSIAVDTSGNVRFGGGALAVGRSGTAVLAAEDSTAILGIIADDTSDAATYPTVAPLIFAQYGEPGTAGMGINFNFGPTPFFMEFPAPSSSLHIKESGTVSVASNIHVGSQETPVGQFTITSADQPRFELNDTTNNRRWRFSVTNTAFAINNLDESGTEFKSFNNGDVEIGGTLFENSDRNSKQDIVAVDHLSVLDRIVALPISEWSYKDAPNQRHIGPMAQDFHAAFGLGRNNTGISTLDTAGVALAGIKALKWQNDRLAKANHQLAAENAELKARMDAMESRQAEIMVALATLRAQQDQPAPVVASLRD